MSYIVSKKKKKNPTPSPAYEAVDTLQWNVTNTDDLLVVAALCGGALSQKHYNGMSITSDLLHLAQFQNLYMNIILAKSLKT